MTRILIVDDDPIVAESLAELLGGAGHTCVTAHDGAEALDILADAQRRIELLVTDMDLPRVDGRALLKEVRDKRPDVVPLVVTGFGKIEDAVEAVKLGAADYLTKPVLDDELRVAVEKAAQTQALLAENRQLKRQLDERHGVGSLIGSDYRMQRAFDLIESVADTNTTVLITGEPGTGKTQAARAVHQLSRRRGGPFVTCTIDQRPDSMIDAELFGDQTDGNPRKKGAIGRLREAHGGTLLIRDVGHATPALQERLLRVLQDKRIDDGKGGAARAINARFVFTAGPDLEQRVADGGFRQDLFYRLNVVPIALPALRDRPGDIPLLAEHFVERYATATHRVRRLSPEAVDALTRYAWPGNVRELESAVERAVVLSAQRTITPDDLPEAVRGEPLASMTPVSPTHHADAAVAVSALADGWTPTPLQEAMAEPERQILLAALRANDWNRSETARQLDIDRTTLYKKIKKHRLDEPL